jgi:hypothetical protein
LFNHRRHIVFLLVPFAFLIPSSNSNSFAAMSDAVAIDLDDAPIIVEKRGPGHPRATKIKPRSLLRHQHRQLWLNATAAVH